MSVPGTRQVGLLMLLLLACPGAPLPAPLQRQRRRQHRRLACPPGGRRSTPTRSNLLSCAETNLPRPAPRRARKGLRLSALGESEDGKCRRGLSLLSKMIMTIWLVVLALVVEVVCWCRGRCLSALFSVFTQTNQTHNSTSLCG